MSTLGTFANFTKLGARPVRPDQNLGQALVGRVKGDSEMLDPRYQKAMQAQSKVLNAADSEGASNAFKAAKKIKNRNLLISAGLGLAGVGTVGAIALSKRKKKTTNMSAQSAYSLFAKKTYGEVTDGMRVGGADLNADQLAKIKAVKDSKNKLDADQLKAVQERSGKYKAQRLLEKSTDTGSVAPKAGVVSRATALAGSPERDLIRSGKVSDNKFIKGASEGAEKFGKMGFQQGATGVRGALNKAVGRTVTGKAVRLGAAGVGIAAIGSALRKKREDQY